MDNRNIFLATQTERAYLDPPRTPVLFACRNRWFFGSVARRRRAAARRLRATGSAQNLLSVQMPHPARRAPGSVQQTSPGDPSRVGVPDQSRRPHATGHLRCDLLDRCRLLAPALASGPGVVRRAGPLMVRALGGRHGALALAQQHINQPHQLARGQDQRPLMGMFGW
jgi:hypothetical protein